MDNARVWIVILGILLPYAARIPLALVRGEAWLAQLWSAPVPAHLFLGLFNAITWGGVLLAARTHRHESAAAFPALFGFSFAAFAYGSLDLTSSSTAAVAVVFIPLWSLPFVLVGAFAGRWWDRRLTREEEQAALVD